MAKGRAECTCSACGKVFVKERILRNRTEAENWESWAERNYDTCPECYGKQMRDEENLKGLYYDVLLDPSQAMYSDNYVVIAFGGDTKPYKDKIKELGAIWTDYYPETGVLGSFFGSSYRPFRWVLRCKMDEIKEKMSLAENIGAKRNDTPTDTDMGMMQVIVNKRQAKEKEMQKEIDSLGNIPPWPDEIKALWGEGEKWNGKFYGAKNCYRIYLSGREINLTNEQKAVMEKTYESRQAWRAEKEKIVNKYK